MYVFFKYYSKPKPKVIDFEIAQENMTPYELALLSQNYECANFVQSIRPLTNTATYCRHHTYNLIAHDNLEADLTMSCEGIN